MKKESAGDIFEPEKPIVPADWDVIPFEEAAQVVSDRGKRVKQGHYLPSGKLPVIDQGQDYIGGYIDDESMAFDGQLPVVLFGDHTRSIKYVDQRFAVGAEGVKILRPSLCYEPKFFYYLLQSLGIPSRGYSRHFQFLRRFHFPVAPKLLQKRIVAEIEKQFSRLDEAVTNLKRVKANLKRYKAAVLKAAVEGKLTEDWRKQHPDIEPASELLKRILAERRAKWNGKGKYKEPAAPDTADLPSLPEGWIWALLDQLQCLLRNGISTKPDAENGLPILRINAVRPLSVNLSAIRYLKGEKAEYADYVLSQGDLLFTRYNGNPELVGVCGVVPTLSSRLVHPDKLIRCKLTSGSVVSDFVAIMANVGASREYLSKRVRTTAGQAGVSGSDLKGMPIPLAPNAEQKQIVAEVERRLSLVNALEIMVSANFQRANRLRQAILQRSFSGKLFDHSENVA